MVAINSFSVYRRKRPTIRQDQWSANNPIRIARVGYARQEGLF